MTDLGEGQAGLQSQIYELRSEVGKIDTARSLQHEQNKERLDELERILKGNGQPGIQMTVTQINTTLRLLGVIIAFVIIPLLAGTAGTVLWDHFTKH